MDSEQALMATIGAFTQKYLAEGEQVLGFVVLDHDEEVIVASTFDPSYVATDKNPIKNWVVFLKAGQVCAKVMDKQGDFKEFALEHCKTDDESAISN